MVSSRQWWNNQPLYILDELVSYVNGAGVGLQLGNRDRAIESLDHAFELAGYAQVMWYIIDDMPNYDNKFLRTFVKYEYHTRCIGLYEAMKAKGWNVSKIEIKIQRIKEYANDQGNMENRR